MTIIHDLPVTLNGGPGDDHPRWCLRDHLDPHAHDGPVEQMLTEDGEWTVTAFPSRLDSEQGAGPVGVELQFTSMTSAPPLGDVALHVAPFFTLGDAAHLMTMVARVTAAAERGQR